jgi:hypothetical protein
MFKKLRKIFHKHDWKFHDVELDNYDESSNLHYNTYVYKCSVCGKLRCKKESYERRAAQ